MESAIFNGFQDFIKPLKRLLCVRHLKQRDEKKLGTLLTQFKKGTTNSIYLAKNNIIQDIYGCRTAGYYEYELAEACDKADFEAKLKSLEQKWKALCPGFFAWFSKIDLDCSLKASSNQPEKVLKPKAFTTKMKSSLCTMPKRSTKISRKRL